MPALHIWPIKLHENCKESKISQKITLDMNINDFVVYFIQEDQTINSDDSLYFYNNSFTNMFGVNKKLFNQLPTQEYLEKIFKDLEKNKSLGIYEEIKAGTVYGGYKTIPIQKLEPKKLAKTQELNGKDLWKKGLVAEVYSYEESCSLSKQYENGFLGAFFEAYINHGDVKITPDDVWMAIMLFFSKYVDNNAERLRNAFVSHQGKKQLVIKTDREKSEYEWNQFFQKVIVAIRENTVKGVTENFQCSFSTTDRFFTIFSTATIMNSFKKYFEYTRMMCACGIQNIHMGGSLEDWEKLGKKLTYLYEFDVDGQLKKYVRRLEPVLDQFIETFKGRANIEFWNNIYHERQDPKAGIYSPKMYANGWILRFFTTQDLMHYRASIEEIDVPIKVVNEITNTVKSLNLVGGCRGVSIENNVYRPHYSFSIVEKKENLGNRRRVFK